ncbi:MAG: hypothetical protein K8F91_03670 [Candidatus Obscuribacterales bacterium]|nr:hypothetical protein [Candidatus Obscuribacterales bacterium]
MIVDLASFQNLKTDIAKQLYTHLAYRFYVETEEGDGCWVADYDWLVLHIGIKPHRQLWRAKQQLQVAHQELKRLGYISDFKWDSWRIIYRPGPVWKGEQLRRKNGKSRSRKYSNPAIQAVQPVDDVDPLFPGLALFASGLSIGEERIKSLGLSKDEAIQLCKDRNIPLQFTTQS